MTRKPTQGSEREPVVVRKDGDQIYVGYDKECAAGRLLPHSECLLGLCSASHATSHARNMLSTL